MIYTNKKEILKQKSMIDNLETEFANNQDLYNTAKEGKKHAIRWIIIPPIAIFSLMFIIQSFIAIAFDEINPIVGLITGDSFTLLVTASMIKLPIVFSGLFMGYFATKAILEQRKMKKIEEKNEKLKIVIGKEKEKLENMSVLEENLFDNTKDDVSHFEKLNLYYEKEKENLHTLHSIGHLYDLVSSDIPYEDVEYLESLIDMELNSEKNMVRNRSKKNN